jgi:hypothetical protein
MVKVVFCKIVDATSRESSLGRNLGSTFVKQGR